MNWKKMKKSIKANFFALLDIFAQESDFINGDRRKAIHQANQKKQSHQINHSRNVNLN
ncbi:hypothetical protein [Limosilactobacillus coleohominis]|uniref:Uncharacterized protein n=1 Tax=Limosilactobacillus coleohominis TaxID=181675 RepID=A0ABS2GYR6_9LACO|nr:hypothetical protein [Limosilactobacillus coleohominis]MBM6941367.1 hypothetical protein [Limosilactobacillus coleohominis]